MARTAGVVLAGLILLLQAVALNAAVAGKAREGGTAEGRADFRVGGREPSYPLPQPFLSAIEPGMISARIEKLQSFGTRFVYSDRAGEAAGYIESELRSMNLTVQRQEFVHNGFTLANVLAVLPGRNASLPALVLGAHYDSINGTDSMMNAYAPAPGADDDASGVAAVLAIAGAFCRAGTERTIIFAAFAGEEVGRVGSIEFVRRASSQQPGLYAGLCFDMIGYNRRFPKVDLVSNEASRWLSDVAIEANRRNAIGVGTQTVVTSDNPQNWSDHVSFWEAGLPAMYFIEDENPTENSSYFEANPYYHTGSDKLDKLNLTLMAKVARLGAAAAAALAELRLPDFEVAVLEHPSRAFEGEQVDVPVHVNIFGFTGLYAGNVSLEVDGIAVLEREVPQNGQLDLYWKATRGRHILTVRIDAEDRYLEEDETNNRDDFIVEVAVRPDLAISRFYAVDTAPVPGRPMTLVVEVANLGGTPAQGTVFIHISEGKTGLLEAGPVAILPGESDFVVQETTAPSVITSYTAEIRSVAPRENITDNNWLTMTIQPHVLDSGDCRIVIEPDVVLTYQTVRVWVEGAGASLDWSVDFGDGHFAGWTGSACSHFYPGAGTYFVGAELRDAKGAVVALEPMPVAVQDRPPVAVIEGASEVGPGRAVDFSAARSFDPDGEVVQYLWDFGEGAREFGPDARHSFLSERTYPVRLTVTDDRGQSNTTLLSVHVVNSPPLARAESGARLLFTGEMAAFDAAGSADADGRLAAYRWDFGDGASAAGPQARHAYSKDGVFAVTLTVTDDRGANSSASLNITVLKKLDPLSPPPRTASPVIIPAALMLMLLVAIALLLRSSPPRARDEGE